MALNGRVALVTGAGRGLGRAHALLLARLGAAVVVNDCGGGPGGESDDLQPANAVVAEIEAIGGRAVADSGDVANWEDADAMMGLAVDTFGRLDILVNNAGILRDAPIATLTEADWAAVLGTHLTGTFATTHFAAQHWRRRAKAGDDVSGRLINTTSASGLFGNALQANYAAAKAGIAAFTIVAAKELARYGVTANAVAPVADTRLSAGLLPAELTADRVSPVVAWLASQRAAEVSGRVFIVGGGHVAVAEGWHAGPWAHRPEGWSVEELDSVLPDLVRCAAPPADLQGRYPGEPGPSLIPGLGDTLRR